MNLVAMGMKLHILLTLFVWTDSVQTKQNKPNYNTISEKDVQELLTPKDFTDGRETLLKIGIGAFEAYDRLLVDPNLPSQKVVLIYHVLMDLDVDRQRFHQPAIQHIMHSDPYVRLNAAKLLGEIGSQQDIAPLVALLGDQSYYVINNSATALKSIGDQSTIIAYNVWLNSGHYNEPGVLRKHVIRCRDELKARLAKEKKEASPTK